MTFGPKNGRKLQNVLMHNIIWANQKTASFVYSLQGIHALFEVYACQHLLQLDVIPSHLSMTKNNKH